MAFMDLQFFSASLARTVSVSIFIPCAEERLPKRLQAEDRFPVCYLLHGYAGDQHSWLRYTGIVDAAMKEGIALVCPAGENLFYRNPYKSRTRMGSFVSHELPHFVERLLPLGREKKYRAIAGLSMGGFGALRVGLENPENYLAIGAFSAPYYVSEDESPLEPATVPALRNAEQLFGPKEKWPETDLNHVRRMKTLLEDESMNRDELPALYLSCGERDAFYPDSQRFFHFAKELWPRCVTQAGDFEHEWAYWDQEGRAFLSYFKSLSEDAK